MTTSITNIVKSLFAEDLSAPVPQPIRPPLPSRTISDASQQTVLLIDCSGSAANDDIQPSRLDAEKTSAIAFVKERAARSPRDEVAIVSYDTDARCVCSMRSVQRMADIEQAINKISLGELTAMGRGLREAEKILSKSGPANLMAFLLDRASPRNNVAILQRVILLTDGHHYHGCDPLPIAERLKQTGVQIDCIGIGGYRVAVDERLLQQIASVDPATGRPRYRFIKDHNALQAHFRQLATGITR